MTNAGILVRTLTAPTIDQKRLNPVEELQLHGEKIYGDTGPTAATRSRTEA